MKDHEWEYLESDYDELGICCTFYCPDCNQYVTTRCSDGPLTEDLLDDGIQEDCNLEKVNQVIET